MRTTYSTRIKKTKHGEIKVVKRINNNKEEIIPLSLAIALEMPLSRNNDYNENSWIDFEENEEI